MTPNAAPASEPQGIASLQTQGALQLGAKPNPTMPGPQDLNPELAAIVQNFAAIKKAAHDAEMRAAEKRQQDLNAQQLPPIRDQLPMALAQMQAAASPPQEAPVVHRAHGGMIERGGLDRLPSRLEFQEGGIVGFSEGGDISNGFDPAEWDSYEEYLAAKRRQQDAQQVSPIEAAKRLLRMAQEAVGNKRESPAQSSRSTGGDPYAGMPEKSPEAEAAIPTQDINTIAKKRLERQGNPSAPRPAAPPAGVAAAVRASQGSRSMGGDPSATTGDPESELNAELLKHVRGQIEANDPDASFTRALERNKKYGGLPEYLAAQEEFRLQREAMRPKEATQMDKLSSFLMGISNSDSRLGNIGGLGAGAKNMISDKQARKEAETAFNEKMQVLKERIAEAKFKGSQADVAAANKDYDDAMKNKGAAITQMIHLQQNLGTQAQRKLDAENLAEYRKGVLAAKGAGGAGGSDKLREVIRNNVNRNLAPAQKSLDAVLKANETLAKLPGKTGDQARAAIAEARRLYQQERAKVFKQAQATHPGIDLNFDEEYAGTTMSIPAAGATINPAQWGKPQVIKP